MLTLLDNGQACKDKVHACDLQILVCHTLLSREDTRLSLANAFVVQTCVCLRHRPHSEITIVYVA